MYTGSHAAFVARWMSSNGFIFWVHVGDVKWGAANSSELVWGGGEGVISDDNWHHLVAVRDDSAGKIYCDGVLEESKDAGFTDSSASDKLFIGMYSGGIHGPYMGLIDEVTIFNVALTENDIKNIMKGLKTAVSPAGKLATTWGEIKAR